MWVCRRPLFPLEIWFNEATCKKEQKCVNAECGINGASKEILLRLVRRGRVQLCVRFSLINPKTKLKLSIRFIEKCVEIFFKDSEACRKKRAQNPLTVHINRSVWTFMQIRRSCGNNTMYQVLIDIDRQKLLEFLMFDVERYLKLFPCLCFHTISCTCVQVFLIKWLASSTEVEDITDV